MPLEGPKPTHEELQEWFRLIAGVAIALMVLVPILAGPVLKSRWPSPTTGDGADDSPDTDLEPGSTQDVAKSSAEEPAPADPDAPWVFTTAGEIWSQPVWSDGLIFVGSDDGAGYALDAAGRQRWRLDTGAGIRSPAIVAGQRVVWTSSDALVHAADAASGDRLWRTGVAAGGAATDGKRLVLGNADGLVAVDAARGVVLWRAAVGAVQAPPAIADDRVITGGGAGRVSAVGLRDGKLLWAFESGGEITTSPVVAGRFVLVTAGAGTIYCLEAATGRVRWRSGTSEFVGSAPAVANGRVFVGGGDGALWAFDLHSGLGLWRRRLAEPVRGTPTVHGDTLWMAAGERYIAAVRASDGEPLHVFAVDGWVSASPIVVAPTGGPERLVFPTSDGSVHGLPLRLVTEELALRPAAGDGVREPRLVIEPTFHDGRPEVLWQAELPGRSVTAPALAAGRVVAAAGRHLVALDAESGEQLWRSTEPAAFGGAPVVAAVAAGGRVLAPRRAASDGRGALVAFDLDGRRLWRSEVDDDVTSRPAVWRERAVFGTAGGRLVAARLDDGSVLWNQPTDGAMTAGPAVAGGRGFGIVVAGGCGGVVYGLSADDGRELWRFRTGACVATDVVLAEASGQEVAYVADSAGNVYALEPTVGGELWSASLGGGAGRRPVVQGGTLFLGSHDGELWSLSALYGGTRWRFEAGGAMSGGVEVDLGVAYAASHDGALHAVGAINGQEFWRLETPDPAYDVSFGDGAVYLVTESSLYALRIP